MREKIVTEITEIVSSIIEVEVEQLKPDALFYEDLGVDSLRALEILAVIENKYSITIAPEKLSEMNSLNQVIKITKEYLLDNEEN